MFGSESVLMALLALVLGGLASIAGGAAGGVLVGRQALGTNLAAMLGAFYGPLAGGAGIVLGLLVLAMAG